MRHKVWRQMVELIGDSAKKEEKLFSLVTLLREGTLNFRWRAAEMLGEEGDLRAVGPLILALTDPYVDVSWIAAKSLGKLGDPEAVPHLIELLKSEDIWNRLGAAEGLGGIRDQKAVQPLVEVLKDDPKPKVQMKAAWALGRIGGETARKALDSQKNDDNEQVRKAVLDALLMIEQEEVSDPKISS